MNIMNRIISVDVKEGYCLCLSFADGTHGTVDLSDLAGRGVFALWNDRKAFAAVRIGERGELVWGKEIDLCPDSLYLRITGQRAEDLYPALKSEPTSA